ncbi:MAG TPA: efflux RND transporter periplasmic adaptor subunit, partial [Sphingobacterium sp.]|nr:efflux RND transporter periplasmic adaptor subunit [Sphingobacterium sp.]
MSTKKLLIAAVAVVLLYSCQNHKETDNAAIVKGFEISETMLKSTSFATVKKENVTEELNFFGKISADQNNYIDIFPLVGGNVVSVNVSLG